MKLFAPASQGAFSLFGASELARKWGMRPNHSLAVACELEMQGTHDPFAFASNQRQVASRVERASRTSPNPRVSVSPGPL